MSTASCLYVGTLHHRREVPPRSFRHRVVMAYVDLEELPGLLRGRLVRRAPGLIRFRRRDYHGPSAVPLDAAVRETVLRHTGARPDGPVRVLTNLRCFGHCFNPVSFYYCFEPEGRHVEAVLAEVTNTPWGERHAYVIPGGVGRFEKAMHVSPFMAMDQSYRCDAGRPGDRLTVSIDSHRGGERVFHAALALERRELSRDSVRWLNRRYPFATVRVLALIYAHAAGLRLAGVGAFPHPSRTGA